MMESGNGQRSRDRKVARGRICRPVLGAAALVIVLGWANTASADVLYNTFGPDDSYDTSVFWENGPFGSAGGYTAMPFELKPGFYTSISLTLPLSQSVVGDPSDFWFQVNVYADDGTPANPGEYPDEDSPGTVLGSIDALASDLPQSQPGEVPLTSFDFRSLTLTGDTRYWVAIETTLDTTFLFSSINWYVNDQGVDGFKAQRAAPFPYDPFPTEWTLFGPGKAGIHGAMRVSGTPIPGPSGLALLLGGGLMWRRGRRG